MNKTAKWIIGIFGLVIGLVVIISLALPLFINPNDYKDTLARKVQEQTGRRLSMPGDMTLDFSIFGLKTVFSMGDVALSSGPAFPDTQLFSSRQVKVNLALWPLITSRELQIKTVELKGVTLNLIRDKNGKTNWDMGTAKAGKPAEQKPASPEQQPVPAQKKDQKGLALDIGGIRIQDINLSFEDRQAGKTVRLSNFNMDIGHVREGKPFPLQSTFELFLDDGKQAPLSARADISTTLTLFLARQNFSVRNLVFKGSLSGGPIPVPELKIELDADIDLDLPAEKVEIRKLTFRQGELQVTTMLSLAGFSGPDIKGDVTVPKFSPRSFAEGFGVALPLEDPRALTGLSADISFAYSPSGLTVSRLRLGLDDSTIQGTAQATGLKDAPVYDLVLRVDQFDLDRYKMKKAAQSGEAAAPENHPAQPAGARGVATAEGAEEDSPIIPVDLLRSLTFNVDIQVDRLKAARLNITDIELKATGDQGLVRLQPFAAALYDGTIRVTGDIDARPEVPTMKLTKVLKGVELGPLFTDMTGKPEVKGKANINVSVTTSGLTKKELTENANGTMNLDLANCEIAKLKIIDTIRAAKAVYETFQNKDKGSGATQDQRKKKKKTTVPTGRPTAFAGLTATGRIVNGVFINNDLLAQSELMKVTGKGTVDLNTEQVDYLLTVYLAKYLERDEESGMVELSDTPIPYRVKGTFDELKQSAALDELLKAEARKALFGELGKRLSDDKAKDGKQGTKKDSGSTEDLINKGLKSLFGN